MTPAGQIDAAIALLNEVFEATVPADRVMTRYFRDRRYIGSKDKAYISQHVYGVIRQKATLDYVVHHAGLPSTARSLMLALLVRIHKKTKDDIKEMFSGEGYAPKRLSDVELKGLEKLPKVNVLKAPSAVRGNFPTELKDLLQEAYGDDLDKAMAASAARAATDLRVNALKAKRADLAKLLAKEDMDAVPTPYSPWGLRITGRYNLFGLPAFKEGQFEVQDEGSQLLALLCAPKPGQTVVDYCAGAGGKTLALAAQMANKGTLYACDIHSYRLEELKKRTRRAGVHNVRIHPLEQGDRWLKKHKGIADVVLVDAPCSGSGTWRRNPDMKWKTSVQDVTEVQAVQADVLDKAARLVKIGGRLIYATCSIFPAENDEQVKAFLARQNGFKLVPVETVWPQNVKMPEGQGDMLQLHPHIHQTDGFFAAVLEREE